MPARKDFIEWFTKTFPHSSIDSDHARSCLAGWNAAEEKLTRAQQPQPAICCGKSINCPDVEHLYICKHDGWCEVKQQAVR